jgi:uncharacterized membrane protein AbrB (regulator of aidB expression)
MISTINASTHVETVPATEASMIQNFVDGITFPWTGAVTERMDAKGTEYVAFAYAAVGAVIGSKVTRSRLAANPDSEPFIGLFF